MEVPVETLLQAGLLSKAALKSKASAAMEARRLEAIEVARQHFLRNATANRRLAAMMSVEAEYAAWFEVFNGVPMLAEDAPGIGSDSFAYTNNIIQRVHAWKERALLAAKKKGRIALALADCKDGRQRRMLRVRLQTPDWVDFDKIRDVYRVRDRMQLEHGVEYHVDHIVPLAGRRAYGLHVHQNLQVLPALANMKKGNRFEFDVTA